MKPSIEQLEDRNNPAPVFLPVPYQPFAPGSTPDQICVPWYGFTTQERVPIPPAGMEPVELQDEINQIPSVFVPIHPTYLQPVPPWFAGMRLVPPGTPDSAYQDINDWSINQPGGGAYVLIPRADWLNLQHAIYYPDPATVPPLWQAELASWQQTVQQDDQALFAVQDAYWASQAPAVNVTPVPTIADPLAADSLVVDTLLKQSK